MSSVTLVESFSSCEHPSQVWEGREGRKYLYSETVNWLILQKSWKYMLTLTFRDEVSPGHATRLFRNLVLELNRDLLGNHHTRKVRHSYFSYVYTLENQTRGVLHIHALVDLPMNSSLIKRLWYGWAGDAQVEPIRSLQSSVHYVCKDILKGGELAGLWLPDSPYQPSKPSTLPDWWE